MKKSCFNCKHLYSAGQNLFICDKITNCTKMKLEYVLDNVCDKHERKMPSNKKTVFYR